MVNAIGVPARVDERKILDVVRGIHPLGILKALSVSSPRESPGKARVNVLAVWEEYTPGVKTHRRGTGDVDLYILAVDRGLFEKDVEKAFLGEVIAGWLIAPYKGLVGREYLSGYEALFKRQKVVEALTGLALEYPQLSSEILIKPRYFLFENLRRMTKIYPPISSIYLDFTGEGREEGIESAMEGYMRVIRELVEGGSVQFKGEYLVLGRGFVEEALKRRFRAIDFLRMVEKSLRAYLIQGSRDMGELLNFYLEMAAQYGRWFREDKPEMRMEDPKSFLHLPTTLGLTSLRDETGIEDFIRQVEPLGEISGAELERFGGVLNEVYLLRFMKKGREERALVKKYQNWVGFKWFPLALWTLGTQDFAVLGRSRLEREYAINSLLHREGYPVPGIYNVDLNRMLLIREFIEGENLVGMVKNILSRGEGSSESDGLRRVGGLIAGVHSLGVSVGDCKPENFIASPGGEIYLIDLEQGAHKGNRVWDVAEFLYYSGHYAPVTINLGHVSDLTRAFVRGYLDGGGDPGAVRGVGGIMYTKVFSLFTLPHVIYNISKTCREEL